MSILVQGIGNELRGDDGVGLKLARRIAGRRLPDVVVEEADPDGLALVSRWEGETHVILVDAVRSGAMPGAWIRLDASRRPLPAALSWDSTHRLGLGEAVELARALNRLPKRLIVFGVEGSRFGIGEGLSAPVKAAMDEVEQEILQELTRAD